VGFGDDVDAGREEGDVVRDGIVLEADSRVSSWGREAG